MIKSALDALDLDIRSRQLLDDPLRDRGAALVRESVLVVTLREAGEVVDEIRVLGHVDTQPAWSILPMRGENHHRLGFDPLRDLLSDFCKFGVGRMACVFYGVGPADPEEVDRHSGRRA